MKRAIEAFKHQNSEISFDPIPVDFRTKNSIYWGPGKMQRSLNFWRIYIYETIGYWVYKLTEDSNETNATCLLLPTLWV